MANPATNWPQRIATGAGLYAAGGGVLTLYGWFAGIPRLTQWKNDGIAMFPNTALAAVLAGVALLVLGRPALRPVSRGLGAIVILIGALTLGEHLTGVDLGIDTLLSSGRWGETAAAAPLRMGPPASVSFTLIGFALIALGRTGSSRAFAVIAALVAMAISTLSITGHLYGAEQMYTLPRLTGIALQSATMILAVATGIVCCVPERSPLRLLLDQGTAGAFARRALPLVILLPLALGAIRVTIQDAGWVDTAFGTALRTLLEIALLTAVVWRGLRLLQVRERALTSTEKELRRQASQLAAVLDTAAIALARTDVDGVIVWANDEELELLGCERGEYIARHLAEFHEDKAGILEVLDRLKRGETVREYVSRVVRKDGTQRTVLIDASPVREDGIVALLQFFTRDITERVVAEESRALFASIVQASDDAIVSKTLEGVITSWNPAAERLFGFTAEEAVGNRIDLVIPPERVNEERDIIARLCRGQTIDHFDTVRRTSSGKLIDVSITVSPVRDSLGNVVGASKIARDISDRKRLESERDDQARRKDEFIAILAHELRNPLAPVRNAAHYLSSLGNAELQQPVGIIDRQVSHMARLIDDLLDVSRISRGQLELRRERTNIVEIVDAAVEACRDEMHARSHTLQTELPTEHVEVEADRDRIVQILSNLLGNAAKYTPPGGLIGLRVGFSGNTVEFVVRDDGIGIPPEKLGEVFDLFTRVEQSLEQQGQAR